MQVSPITMSRSSQRASAPPCLPLFIRGPEGGLGACCFLPLAFGLEGFFGLGFWGALAWALA
jgi:hypothetical protein